MVLLAHLIACGEVEYQDVDPPIVLEEGFLTQPVEGPMVVNIGFLNDGQYVALGDGQALPVLHGLQGGYWSMPTVRTTGIGSPAVVSCTVVAETGEQVSQLKVKAKFSSTDEGALELRSFPIPIGHEGGGPNDGIDDLYGLEVELIFSVEDSEGRSDTVTLDLVIEKSE